MLRQELDFGYFQWIRRPGEYLGVFDNETDYQECKRRVHCNATHGSLQGKIVYNEELGKYQFDPSAMKEAYEQFNAMETGRRHTVMEGGDHNNVYFPDYIKYKKTLPACLMQTLDGKYLELHDPLICNGEGVPMPAVDDPVLTALNAEALAKQAKLLRESQFVIGYVLGFEELYPEYFGLGNGDFRPESWEHFMQWLKQRQESRNLEKAKVCSESMSAERFLWSCFREQAMTDRCIHYYRAVLNADPNHLAFYPTHGSTLSDSRRWQLAQQPSLLAAACDGMEMGHILIEEDEERRNVIMVCHYTSFGAPVIIPRLGNKRADLSAIGGGVSFNPRMLRRLVYECVGLGIDTIFPIHWTSRLHDGEWFIKDTPAELELRCLFDELNQAAVYLNGCGRLQPQIGLLAGDGVWIESWNPRWTGMMQEALKRQWSMTVIADVIVNRHLVNKMPLVLLVDQYRMTDETIDGLWEYLEAGGKAIIWGRFLEENQRMQKVDSKIKDAILQHKGVWIETTAPCDSAEVLHELFLAGADYGVAGPRFEYYPVPMDAIEKAILQHAPECILRTAMISSRQELQDLNIYTLTDRNTLVYVLINNGSERLEFELQPDERLMPSYELWDVIKEQPALVPLVLAPYATRMIWAYQKVDRNQVKARSLEAEKCFEDWQRMNLRTEALRLNYVQSVVSSNKYKQYAMAEALLHSLAMRVNSSVSTDGGIKIIIQVFDKEGSVRGAKVTFRMTPGTFKIFECLEKEAEGEYICELAPEELTLCYDMVNKTYVPLSGQARLVIQAISGEKSGGCVENILI